ncbi:uncharacterized protein B0H18DRAFT_950178 [Fomitopsis serialis]|uniref:uncharacterized protein n=1 Tax=Fomitopsis serialis TaxID=139415 RepID=UPI0020088785|nr:uncharacterized protein B0H18DRAFT_950178 [Neoantrodia serialis]KAH9937265.1 hypothetical protein B0H18DRAFT_950178 [Neoantrodia serialis]
MFRAGQLDDALALFTEALTLEGNEYTLYDSCAAVKEKLGKTKDALRDSKRVIDLAPQRWQGYARSARLFLKIRKYDNALYMIKLALERVSADDSKRRAELEALQCQILQGVDEQRELTSRTSYHFGQLPLELAADIFTSALTEDHARVVVLAQVCKNWRLIITNTPHLWNNLVLSKQSPVKKAKAWSTRSRGRIVHLTLRESLKGTPWALDELQDLSLESLRTLRLADFPLGAVRQRLPNLTSDVLRTLDVLDVDNRTEAGPVTWLWTDPSMAVRSLSVYFAVFDWASLVTYFPRLEHFTFKAPLVDIPLSALSDFLRAHVGLRSLSLGIMDFVYHRAPDREQPPVHLPHLERLEIEYHDFAMSFMFPLLHLPTLRSLNISRGVHAIDTSLQHLITSGAGKSLRELRISLCAVSAGRVVDLLHEAEALEVLELRYLGGNQANTILHALSEQPKSPPRGHDTEISKGDGAGTSTVLCPSLSYLDFSHCPDVKSGPLMALVKARLSSTDSDGQVDVAAASTQPAPIDTLIVDGCPSVEIDILPWLRSKVRRVSCVYMSKKDAKWRR